MNLLQFGRFAMQRSGAAGHALCLTSSGLRRSLCILLCFATWMVAGCSSIRPPHGVSPITKSLVVTGYCDCGKCCGWQRDWKGRPVYASGPNEGKPKAVGVTARGSKARVGTIAADTRIYPFGTVMFIDGYGYGEVEDRGGSITGDRIDVFFRSHQQAKEWGKKRLPVRVWIPKHQ